MTATDWDDLRFFLAVARTGSLVAAAATLDVGASTVGRRLARLETALGTVLFSHHTTGYALTEQGRALLERATLVETSIGELETVAAGSASEPEGTVRLATAENLANFVIIPALPGFRERWPNIVLEIVTGVAPVNLTRREADLAVRLVRPTSGNVMLRRLGTLGYGLYGSPGYVSTRTDHPDEAPFERDDFVGWAEDFAHLPAAAWLQRRLAGRAPALATHSLYAQIVAARAGLGLALVPRAFAADDPALAGVAFDGPDLEETIWLVTHRNLAASAPVKAVSDFLVELFDTPGARLAGDHGLADRARDRRPA